MNNAERFPTGYRDWYWEQHSRRWFLFGSITETPNAVKSPPLMAIVWIQNGEPIIKPANRKLVFGDFTALSRLVHTKWRELEGGAA